MATGQMPDWSAAETLLVEHGTSAIREFSIAHPSDVCSFFAFSVDHCYGDFQTCFDDVDNGLLFAKRHEVQTLKKWDTVLNRDKGWEDAKYHIQKHRLCSQNPETANFKYPSFTTLHLPNWEPFFLGSELPESPDPIGHVIVLMYRVIGRLISTSSFDRLTLAAPFRVGVEFPEDIGLVVLKLQNWPAHRGPRV